MPILRAGPWGNLTNAFQSVPFDTSGQLDYYPVNCAKTDWPSQVWSAWYEAEAAGCCTPDSITGTFIGAFDTFQGSASWYQDNCNQYIITGFHPYYGEPYTWELSILWSGVEWEASFQDFSPGSEFSQGVLDNGDECDPTGTYTMNYGSLTVV